VSVTISSFDFEDTFFNGKERNIKSTTTKIENEDVSFFFALSIKTIGDSCSSWFIDNSENIDSGNSSCILSGLSLGIIEISWDCNDSRFDSFTQVSFSNFLHLYEDHG